MVRIIAFLAFLFLTSCTERLAQKIVFKGTTYTLPPGALITSQTFTHVAGFKLPDEFTSPGLGLVTNSNGDVIKLVAGNHSYQQSMAVYDIRGRLVMGATNIANYPTLTKEITLTRNNLYPNWDPRHDIRDYFVTSSNNGVTNRICGVGRMYYNTNPQLTTNIHCRQTTDNFTTLGSTETIPVNIREQWVTGFGGSESRLWGGAYDSGQGTTMGPVLAKKENNGSWSILYRAPNLGDFSNSSYPVLPRPLGYSCAAGNTWVCHEPMPIPPTNEVRGVWTTDRIAGGGAEIGDVAVILPTLGFGVRDYAYQSYTFGLSQLDKTYAYYFRKNATTGNYEFLNYDEWPFSNPGEHIIGMKIGKLEGQPGVYLFVVRSNAYNYGIYKTGSVVDIFRISAEAQ